MAKTTYIVNKGTPEGIQGAEVYTQADKELLTSFNVNSTFESTNHFIELHILSLSDELIESEYDYSRYSILQGGQVGTKGASLISIDPVKDVQYYGYNTGGVKLLYHLYNDIFTEGKTKTDFFIQNISPDRTELQLNNLNITREELTKLAINAKTKLESQSYFNEFRLNFGNNDLFIVTNLEILYTGNEPTVIVKLYEPLPIQYTTKTTLNIVEFVSDSIVYTVDSTTEVEQETTQTLRAANFNLEIADESVTPSQYFNYDELFSYQVGSSNNEIYSLISEKGAELSIDHSSYENFIHFSSAEERLVNFKYKLDLINNYSSSLQDLNGTTPSTGVSGSVTYFQNLIQGIVSNFDHYERFLYYESGSNSWPKSTSVKPFINKPSSDSESITWYADKRSTAILYDKSNSNQLLNAVPSYLRDDPNNENYSIFVHMIAQHFDTLWIYTKAVTDKYNADNRLNSGISKDLVEEALKNFGVKIYTSNKSIEDLFGSFIGQAYQEGNETILNYTTGSLIDTNDSIPPSSYKNYQKEIYKRIYHNLSYLVKSKGTERGLRALINCFGIPSDTLTINYFGGRNVEETPFVGDYRYYTSSLDKVRLDNTGSLIEGDTLSQFTSIIKRDPKYTDDLHRIEVGFSPTNEVNKYLESQLNSDFNIDDFLGDPGNLYLDSYQGLQAVVTSITQDLDRYNVKDYVRLIKFFDNVIFRMIKDFIPARSIADTGIIIKPHILDRSKIKNVQVTFTQPEYSGSIDTAFITGSNAGAFTTVSVDAQEGELNTAYLQTIQTPYGPGIDLRHFQQEAKFDGQFQNSNLTVTTGELNEENIFKTPTFNTNIFDINRWVNSEGLCILSPINSYPDPNGGIYLDNGVFYIDSGSYYSTDFFSGLSQTGMEYEITSSGVPTGSYTFPFNTDEYVNYTVHPFTASNNSGDLTNCTASFDIKVAICDIEPSPEFKTSIKPSDPQNITSWFITGSQNTSSNVNLTVVNNSSPTPAIYNNLLQGATAITLGGLVGDTYTITVQDTQIAVTCTFTYTIEASLCSITLVPTSVHEQSNWKIGENIGTAANTNYPTSDEFNYGISRLFLSEDPSILQYNVTIRKTSDNTVVHQTTLTPGGTGTGNFHTDTIPGQGVVPILTWEWTYGPTSNPVITGNVALFQIKYSAFYGQTQQNLYPTIGSLAIPKYKLEITALESEECTPTITLPPVYGRGEFIPLCCFTGDTLVSVPNGMQVRIDALNIGDQVISFNEETGEQGISTVLSIPSPTRKDIIEYVLSNGIILEATIDHPIWTVEKGWSVFNLPNNYTPGGEIHLNLIERGDTVLLQDNTTATIENIVENLYRIPETVYNLSLDKDYTYYANNILVHNEGITQCVNP